MTENFDRRSSSQKPPKRQKPGNGNHSPHTQKLRRQKNVDCAWILLSKISADVGHLVLSSEGKTALQELGLIIRNRHIADYVKWCDTYSLTYFNEMESIPTVLEIRALRLLTLASKFDFSNSPFDKEAAALDKFKEYEQLCKETNERHLCFHALDHDIFQHSSRDVVVTLPLLKNMREFIKRVLGKLDINEVFNKSHHGPGVTAEKRSDDAVPIAKYDLPLACTPAATSLFYRCFITDNVWVRNTLITNKEKFPARDYFLGYIVETPSQFLTGIGDVYTPLDVSVISFVPKNAKILRTVMFEPSANVYLQLGVKEVIQSNLKKFGIDLKSQQKNKDLCQRGSATDDVVTLDISGASDSQALALLNLLPEEWADLLLKLRTPSGQLPDGEIVHFEKISSMGNGFTFPLESLLFSSMVYSCSLYHGIKWRTVLKDVAVYGDDIIVPKQISGTLLYLLKFCGFKLNYEKSFLDGPVRESCGVDCFNGFEISRPTIKSAYVQAWQVYRDYNLLYQFSTKYGIKLTSALSYLESLVIHKQWGPIGEDVISWFFSEVPKDAKLIKASVPKSIANAWQTPVYKLRRTRITYGIPYNNLSVYDQRLRNNISSCVYQYQEFPSTGRLEPRLPSNSKLPSKSSPHTFETQVIADFELRLFYSKSLRKVSTTVVYIPVWLWRNPLYLSGIRLELKTLSGL